MIWLINISLILLIIIILLKIFDPKKQLQLKVPQTRLKTYGDRSFESAAAREWNKLPLEIKQSPSLSVFKSKVKTRLFKLRYEE
jgi:biopolymer transport protein ExbD